MQKLISFVIPCYRSEKTIKKVVEEIIQTVALRDGYDYEIIAVNDCSPDGVYDVLKSLASSNKKIKLICLAKNMGKHAAVLAGYSVVKGELIVNLDDDYQSPVNNVWSLIDLVENDDCDCASAEYVEKKESRMKIFGSNINMWMGQMLLDKPKGFRFENLSVLKAFVVKEILNYKQPYPYLEGLILRVTKNVKTVKMEQRERADSNKSGYTLKRSVSLLFNGLTAFSVGPLRFASLLGLLFSFVGFVYGFVTIIRKIINPEIMMGYSSILSAILFSSGLIMLMLGIIGEYIGRIYICLNNSPQYTIKETINC